MSLEITSAPQFETILKENTLVICDFHAAWCGPCKMISPKFKKFAETYTKMKFISLDVDEVPEVAEQAEISSMPTFHIYKDAKMVEEIIGADPVKLEAAIKKYAL
ncbi:Cytoplasmic thioredoxin isoenzyme 2 [Boothiomyces sp. JEL0866]|nr:Cytoplasmic thioredoxin isoenzyme 2 [Boothiomyces sp. JEL0866]